MAIHNKDLWYLAGLFDGEGSFGIYGKNGAKLCITMTDEEPIKLFANFFGLHYHQTHSLRKQNLGHKAQYSCQASGKSALRVAKILEPLLKTPRRIRAQQIIELYKPRFCIECGTELINKRFSARTCSTRCNNKQQWKKKRGD